VSMQPEVLAKPAAAGPSAPLPPGLPLSARLRAETRGDHLLVDAAYGRFDLARRDGYAAFLLAQARVLPALEALLRPGEMIPAWRGRTAAILTDLHDLGRAAPAAIAPAIGSGAAARWGAVYVLEGSRLGGAVLARQVPPGLPAAFLGAVHPSGAWRDLLARIDAANPAPAAQADAIAAAKATFAAFASAASAR